MKITRHRVFTLIWIISLTFLGGATSVSAIMLYDTTITNHTGNISHAAIAVASGQLRPFLVLLLFVGLFGLGSVIAGFLFYKRTHNLKLLYTFLPIILGVSLTSAYFMDASHEMILFIIAFGMGLQNGTYFKVKGILIRTTHMTGYLTDAAFSLGAVLKGNTDELWKVQWYMSSILVYFFGGVGATVVVYSLSYMVWEVIGFAYIALGLFVYLFNPQLEHN